MILSIIVPVYNEEKTIKKCIDRVLSANTLKMDLEIIVSDNNSTDNTKEILKEILGWGDMRISEFHEEGVV